MTGYFTTEELFEKNREFSLEFTKDFEIMENPLKIKNQTKSGNIETKENKIKDNDLLGDILACINVPKKVIKENKDTKSKLSK